MWVEEAKHSLLLWSSDFVKVMLNLYGAHCQVSGATGSRIAREHATISCQCIDSLCRKQKLTSKYHRFILCRFSSYTPYNSFAAHCVFSSHLVALFYISTGSSYSLFFLLLFCFAPLFARLGMLAERERQNISEKIKTGRENKRDERRIKVDAR